MRTSIPDAYAYDLYCRDVVRDGQFVTWLGRPSIIGATPAIGPW